MPARLIDGKAIAQEIRDDLAARVAKVRDDLDRPPGLSIVLVGDDPASQVYVRSMARGLGDKLMSATLITIEEEAGVKIEKKSS